MGGGGLGGVGEGGARTVAVLARPCFGAQVWAARALPMRAQGW